MALSFQVARGRPASTVRRPRHIVVLGFQGAASVVAASQGSELGAVASMRFVKDFADIAEALQLLAASSRSPAVGLLKRSGAHHLCSAPVLSYAGHIQIADRWHYATRLLGSQVDFGFYRTRNTRGIPCTVARTVGTLRSHFCSAGARQAAA